MAQPIVIVGQGLAGSLLAWALEQAGIPFLVYDQGHEHAASRVGAGIINPVTGQRYVPSWRVEELLPLALAMYRDIEYATGVTVVRPFRLRRLFASGQEAKAFHEKWSRGELARWIEDADAEGCWVRDVHQVDFLTLITALRERWKKSGHLREEVFRDEDDADKRILCTGRFIPALAEPLGFRLAEGTVIEVTSPRVERDLILNRVHWVLPVHAGRARVGSTYHVGGGASADDAAALQTSAQSLLGGEVSQVGLMTGWRVASPDRLPRIGWLDAAGQRGIFNGLGSKGALFAPYCAQCWSEHLREGRQFPREFAAHF